MLYKDKLAYAGCYGRMVLYMNIQINCINTNCLFRKAQLRGHRNFTGLAVLFFIIAAAVSSSSCSPATEKRPEISDIKTHVRNILSLPTYEQVYRDIIYYGEEAKVLIFKVRDKKLLFSVNIRLQAGFDLSKGLKIEPLNRHEVTVRLPKAELLSVDADESSIHEYFAYERGGEISRLEYYEVINANKEDIRKDALERGILENAERNGKQVIENLLLMAGYSKVYFEPLQMDIKG